MDTLTAITELLYYSLLSLCGCVGWLVGVVALCFNAISSALIYQSASALLPNVALPTVFAMGLITSISALYAYSRSGTLNVFILFLQYLT